MKRVLLCVAVATFSASDSQIVLGQSSPPAGLAASALANEHFTWIHRDTSGFRVHFLADSYPARHQDSLMARLPVALAHAQNVIDDDQPLAGPIDLFFIESRSQMAELVGGPSNGFAQPSARTVFLVTHPGWRAFEKHEIMHVVAGERWGAAYPGNDWLIEGLAQSADGSCGRYRNSDVALALAARHGWIALDDVLSRSAPSLISAPTCRQLHWLSTFTGGTARPCCGGCGKTVLRLRR
jgi:hypothetical protein